MTTNTAKGMAIALKRLIQKDINEEKEFCKMDYSRYKTLVFERKENGVLYVKFNRPEKLNALNGECQEELSRVFADIALDEETKIVVITGEGKAFSAGGDISGMAEGREARRTPYNTLKEGVNLIRSLIELPQPLIARVNGHAIGLGATIALYSDIILVAKNAKIADTHIKVGLVAGDGGTGVWSMALGPTKAKRYLLTGDPISPEEAERFGLITEAVAAEELDDRVNYYIDKLSSLSPLAVQLTKRGLNLPVKKVVDAIVEPSFAFEMMSIVSDEHKEAVSAFKEKRKPNF